MPLVFKAIEVKVERLLDLTNPAVLKALGHAIGQRPLLTLGVLLVVVGLQFFSLGLISEMVTSHH